MGERRRLSIRSRRLRTCTCPGGAAGPAIELTVSDTVRHPDGELPKIFDPFFTSISSCLWLRRAKASSRPTEGIYVRARSAAHEFRHRSARGGLTRELGGSDASKILVVDDEEVICRAVAGFSGGIEVYIVSDGAEGCGRGQSTYDW